MALGLHRLRPFIARARPTFSQALSGLVKSIRIRRVQDAVYWLLYLDTFREAQYRFRTARRLLIGSAEDGHSIVVMEKVLESFPRIARSRTGIQYLAAEAVRICKLPNWWHPDSGGRDCIYNSLVAERELAYFTGDRSPENMARMIERGIEEKRKTVALAGVMGLPAARMGATKQAELVLSLAKKYQNSRAERLAEIHLRAKSALSSDNNFISQAVWMLVGGVSPIADAIEPVADTEVENILERAKEMWEDPRPIPGWCTDGLHCAGNDTRFAGMLPEMMAVCNAFSHYGRCSPEDRWLPEFKCYDGLIIERA
jgi:hypothetical protein